jgi:polysaccharide deacetylase family protein (PEP-CTERM system associated)
MVEMTSTRPAPLAAMSIDVEDWFQVENLKLVVPRATWDGQESRVARNTSRILELLEEHGARATFFVLGWVAERQPELIRRIAAAGHEIASHGYGHDLLYTLTPAEFRADVERGKKLLEDLTGQRVTGYRAPSFSITDWAVGILQELGFEYDSSVFPTVVHDRYGRLTGIDAGQPILELRPGFHEMCISCLPLGKRGLPWGGGGYFRMLPYRAWRAGVQRILASGSPYMFYLHPWEIDPGQPRVHGLSPVSRFRHYLNLARCEGRFAALLADFPWTTVRDVLEQRKPALSLPRSA